MERGGLATLPNQSRKLGKKKKPKKKNSVKREKRAPGRGWVSVAERTGFLPSFQGCSRWSLPSFTEFGSRRKNE